MENVGQLALIIKERKICLFVLHQASGGKVGHISDFIFSFIAQIQFKVAHLVSVQ